MKAEEVFNKHCTLINRNYGDYVIHDSKLFIKDIQKFAELYHDKTSYTTAEILKAAEEGEVNMIDAQHVCEILERNNLK
jgi:hypothetical protein